MMIQPELGRKISELRKAKGLTQEEIEIFIRTYEQPNQQAFSFAIAYILKQFLPPRLP